MGMLGHFGSGRLNYYKRHLGDYAKDTGHLSAIEHGVYTLLLDRYYSTEKPIPQAEAHKVARARTADERAAADVVLREFFKLQDGEWHHSYADRVIEVAHKKAGSNRKNGKLGGRPPQFGPHGTKANGTQEQTKVEPKGNPDETHSVISGLSEITLATNPLATSHQSTKQTHAGDFHAFWFAYPNKKGKGAAMQSYLRALQDAPHGTLMAALEAQRVWPQWTRDGGRFIPHPATWLNQKRWLDEAGDPNEQTRSVIEEAERIAFGAK